MTYNTGDIFLIDSDSTESRIVKFLMSSDTVGHWLVGKLYEKISKKVAPSWLIRKQFYYHVGMILNEKETIEQQAKVEKQPISRLNGKKHVIIRRIGLSDNQKTAITVLALNDFGKGYDILLILGKTLNWLTGVPLFTLLLNWPTKELCPTRVAYWHYKITKELWGRLNYNFVQTDDIYYWAKSHPELYTIVEEV